MYLEQGPEVGRVILAAGAVVGISGKPVALYGYTFKSAGTAGVLTFFNGTAATAANVAWDDTGIISTTKVVALASGIVFPNGLFASFDANITTGTFFVRQVLT